MPVPEAPLVSVLVPTYQHGRYIAACLESILAQTGVASMEVLVGEDASNDGTREICLDFGKRYPDRIQVVLHDRSRTIHLDGTPTGLWNLIDLFHRAKGKYLAVLEGDDLWTDPTKLSRQLAIMEADPRIAGTYHDTLMIDGEGRSMDRLFVEGLPDRLEAKDVVGTLAAFHTSSFLFRNGPHYRRTPDWFRRVGSLDMAMFALAADEGVLVKVPGAMSAYRKHGGGITDQPLNKGALIHFRRMFLWTQLARTLRRPEEDRIADLLGRHLIALRDQIGPEVAKRMLFRLLRSSPLYFLRRPKVLRMLLSVVRAAR